MPPFVLSQSLSRWRLSRRHSFRCQRPRTSQGRLFLESLEDRSVPSILFDNTTTATVSDGGGRVLDRVRVELVFWGAGWSANATLQSNVTDAVDRILAGPYFSALSQYRGTIGNGSRVGQAAITNSDPPSVFHDSDVKAMLAAAINDHSLPSPIGDNQLLYMVIPQPGSSAGSLAGEHSYAYSSQGPFHYGWIIDDGSQDTITFWFSHELVEAVTDPDGTAIQVNPRNPTNWNEIGDYEAQNYSYRLNNVKVQSYFSQRDHAYIVPTGQSQNFSVSTSRTLTVAGGQLGNPNDAITIDRSGSNGVLVSLNGEIAQFDANAIGAIVVSSGTGAGGANVRMSGASVPTTLTGNPSAANTLIGPNTPNVWRITGTNAGTLMSAGNAPVAFASFQNLTGGDNTDTFIFSNGQGVSGAIDGGGGGDWLDYSAYTTVVAVNLETGHATGASGGVQNIGNVIGGSGNDTLTGNAAGNILMGGAGVNVLHSGGGRGLLIGGSGAATMTGGANDDLFIAGTTSFDLNPSALTSILAEWRRTDKSFQDRIADLQSGSGGLNGANHLLWGTTVFDNGRSNILTGGAGQNWFFSGNLAGITNWKPTDRIGSPVDLVFALGLDERIYAQKVDARGGTAGGYFLVQPGAVKAFSAARDGQGHLELFVIGLNDRVYAQKFDSDANPLGSYVFTAEGAVKSIVVGHDAVNHPEVFVIGLDDRVWAQKFDVNGDSIGPYFLTADGRVKTVQVGHDAANHPEVFVIGLDDRVWAQKFDANGDSTSPYFLTRAGAVKDLRVASDAANHPEVFVIGLDNQVYNQKFDAAGNSASAYALTSAGQVKSLQVGHDAGNRPEVFVIGLDNQVYAQKFDAEGGAAGGYFSTASGQVKSIRVSHDANNHPLLFAVGLDDQVYAQGFDGNGNPIGPYLFTAPGMVKMIAVSN